MKDKKKLIVIFIIVITLIITVLSFEDTNQWSGNNSSKANNSVGLNSTEANSVESNSLEVTNSLEDNNTSENNSSVDWISWKSTWNSVKNNYEQIALTPGSTEEEINFAWYSKKSQQAKIRISKKINMSNPIIFKGTSSKYKQIKGVTYYTNKVTATGLNSKSIYYYQCYLDGKWTETRQYVTQDSDDFSFLFVGDPQIGASEGQTIPDSNEVLTDELAAGYDSFNWNTTLMTAVNANPDLSFIVTAGDQINEYANDESEEKDLQQEMQYSGFLSPKLLSSLPIATSIGNHDSYTANYKNHFNNPNSFIEETTPAKAGNGYFFTYGDTLFIMLDTNNDNFLDHEALLKKATEANPDVTWRIVTFHHDIYGSGSKHSETDVLVLRKELTKLMDEYDIDVVLQGHDHTYSRSFQLASDKTGDSGYKIVSNMEDAADNIVTNPEGVLYIEANSSTGSKFYDLISTAKNYIAVQSQTWTPTYSVIEVANNSLSIATYDVTTGKKIDKSYTINKTKE